LLTGNSSLRLAPIIPAMPGYNYYSDRLLVMIAFIASLSVKVRLGKVSIALYLSAVSSIR